MIGVVAQRLGEGGQRAKVLALGAQQQAVLKVGVDQGWVEPDRFAEVFQGALAVIELTIGQTPAVIGQGVVGIEAERAVVG